VSSRHDLHYEHAAAALVSGRHILCEKPMTLNFANAKKLASLAESKGLHTVISFGWSLTDYATEASKRVLSGEIGRVQHVLCHRSSALRDLFSGKERRGRRNPCLLLKSKPGVIPRPAVDTLTGN